MKSILSLLLLLFAFACENKPQTEAKEQVNTAASISVNESASPVIEENSQATAGDGAQTYQLRIGQAGNIRKGMAAKELYTLFDSTQVEKQKSRGNKEKYMIRQNSNDMGIICTTSDNGIIQEIMIQSDAYTTDRGIGVGDTFADLTNSYHVAKIYADKDLQVHVQVEELQKKQYNQHIEETVGIEFVMGFDATGLLRADSTIPPSAIPPDAKIVRVLL